MDHTKKAALSLINPNWSAFVLLIVFLSVFNSLARLLLPLAEPGIAFLTTINISISFILWADFFYLLRKSEDRRYFMTKQHGWMVLLGSFPFLRALRVLWFRLILRADSGNLKDFISQIAIKKNAQGTLLLILFIAICVFEFSVAAVLTFEVAAADGNIKTISDALWWAFVTVSTVGYGDTYPVTPGGRLVGILLIGVGIALFSVVTGSLAEWFTDRRQENSSLDISQGELQPSQAVAAMMQLLEKQESEYQQTISELRQRLAELEAGLD